MQLLLHISVAFLYLQAACASSAQNKHKLYPLKEIAPQITNGSDAYPGQFPYQAAIVWGQPPLIKYKIFCGGSILNEKWILSSAHCILSLPRIGNAKVKLGKHSRNEDSESVQTLEVAVRFVHSDYDSNTRTNDIALLKLSNPIKFNARVQSVKLPNADVSVQNSNAIITGWGVTSTNVWFRLPKVLQKAEVKVIENNICNQILKSLSEIMEAQETHLCTGPLNKPASVCMGDSGGPLIQISETQEAIQIGITSWHALPCGKEGAPSVYTKISSYIEWINQKINSV